MTVKILIKRKVTGTNIPELTVLLQQLRSLSLNQPGYITGETLKRIDEKDEYLVISTWRTMEDWNTWLADPQRIAIQTEIDRLLNQKTQYAVYEV